MTHPQFGRLITAMVTPFDEKGEVAYSEALRLSRHLVETGTDTVLLAGTTGESPTLTHEEEFELFQLVSQALKGKAKVMAGTGSNCTRTAIQSTLEAEKLGVDGVLQVVPYYNKPSQEGIYQHFKAVAKETSLPIILYNIPGRTGRNMEPETVARLAEIPNIVGLKESTGDLEQFKKIRALTPAQFTLYSGDDNMTFPFMKEGAYGVISVASHCVGRQIKDMMEAFVAGNVTEAERLHQFLLPLFDGLFIAPNPAPVKAALEMMGFSVGGLRLPLVPVTEAEKKTVKKLLVQTGVLK